MSEVSHKVKCKPKNVPHSTPEFTRKYFTSPCRRHDNDNVPCYRFMATLGSMDSPSGVQMDGFHDSERVQDDKSNVSAILANLRIKPQSGDSEVFVARLPTELLQRIFAEHIDNYAHKGMYTLSHCRECSPAEAEEERKQGQHVYLPVQAVSQVCHHWRSLALSFPELWTDVPTHQGAALFEEMCLRSGDRPLSVQINLGMHSNHARCRTVRAVFGNLHRVRHLDIGGWNWAIDEVMSRHTDYKAPLLQHLTITATTNVIAARPNYPRIITQPCPSLTSLTLHQLHIACINPQYLSRLQELHIVTSGIASSSTGIDDIVSLLEVLPLLRKISLLQRYVATEYQPGALDPRACTRSAILPNAQSIVVDNFYVWALKYLILPSDVRIEIDWSSPLQVLSFLPLADATLERCVSELCSILEPHFSSGRLSSNPHQGTQSIPRSTPPTIRRCQLMLGDGDDFWASLTVNTYQYRVNLRHTVRPSHAGFRLLFPLFEIFPLSTTRCLDTSFTTLSAEDWKELFRHLPLVDELSMMNISAFISLVKALRSGDTTHIPFPVLRRLVFQVERRPNVVKSSLLDESITDTLAAMLAERSARGYLLQILIIPIEFVEQVPHTVKRLTPFVKQLYVF